MCYLLLNQAYSAFTQYDRYGNPINVENVTTTLDIFSTDKAVSVTAGTPEASTNAMRMGDATAYGLLNAAPVKMTLVCNVTKAINIRVVVGGTIRQEVALAEGWNSIVLATDAVKMGEVFILTAVYLAADATLAENARLIATKAS